MIEFESFRFIYCENHRAERYCGKIGIIPRLVTAVFGAKYLIYPSDAGNALWHCPMSFKLSCRAEVLLGRGQEPTVSLTIFFVSNVTCRADKAKGVLCESETPAYSRTQSLPERRVEKLAAGT